MLCFFYKLKASHSTSKQIMTHLLQYLLYCSGLELNPQSLWSMPVIGLMLRFAENLSPDTPWQGSGGKKVKCLSVWWPFLKTRDKEAKLHCKVEKAFVTGCCLCLIQHTQDMRQGRTGMINKSNLYAKCKELPMATQNTLLRRILGQRPSSLGSRSVVVRPSLLWARDGGAVVSGILGRCTLDSSQEFCWSVFPAEKPDQIELGLQCLQVCPTSNTNWKKLLEAT